MTRLAGCLALCVGIGVTAHGEPASGPWLKLRWHDPTGAFPSASTAIAEELRAIVAPAGLEFDWREMRPGEVSRTAGIDIVLLRAMSPGAALPPSTLGVVRASAAGQPAAWVLLDSVRRALDLQPLERPLSPGERAIVARAVGRILAHELVHLLAPRLAHARSGLMHDRLGRAQLLGDRPSLDAAVVSAIRPVIATATLPRPQAPGVELVDGEGGEGGESGA